MCLHSWGVGRSEASGGHRPPRERAHRGERPPVSDSNPDAMPPTHDVMSVYLYPRSCVLHGGCSSGAPVCRTQALKKADPTPKRLGKMAMKQPKQNYKPLVSLPPATNWGTGAHHRRASGTYAFQREPIPYPKLPKVAVAVVFLTRFGPLSTFHYEYVRDCAERARVSGERPMGAASCRQQHNQAPCQPPAPVVRAQKLRCSRLCLGQCTVQCIFHTPICIVVVWPNA